MAHVTKVCWVWASSILVDVQKHLNGCVQAQEQVQPVIASEENGGGVEEAIAISIGGKHFQAAVIMLQSCMPVRAEGSHPFAVGGVVCVQVCHVSNQLGGAAAPVNGSGM